MINSSTEVEVQALHILLPLLGIISAIATIMGLFEVAACVQLLHPSGLLPSD